MAFQYPLEKLLQLRQQQQSEEAQRLLLKQEELSQCHERLQELKRKQNECESYLTQSAGLSGAELELVSIRSQHLVDEIEKQSQLCQKLQKELEEQRKRLEKAIVVRRCQERHRENVRERWAKQEKKKEQRQQEELVLQKDHNKGGEVQDE